MVHSSKSCRLRPQQTRNIVSLERFQVAFKEASSKPPEFQVVLDKKYIKPQKEQVCFLVQLTAIEASTDNSTTVPPSVQNVLNAYEDIFQTPTSLPPVTKEDHLFPIMEGSRPVYLNPHKCPYLQCLEIEKMVREMLDSGIIRYSQSPYASPFILVKRRDNTWRFCMDYKALNAINLKNIFPIPLIEEMMDELHGSRVFSKLDLQSGYHQICVSEQDIHKMAFKT